MPANLFTSDSIGKCSYQADQYDARLAADPRLVRRRQQEYVRAQDSIASSQARLEKEVFRRLAFRNFQLPSGAFFAFLKGGKFIFYGLAVPFYFIFMGVPKWLFIKSRSRFFFGAEYVKRVGLKIGKRFAVYGKKSLRVVNKIFISLIALGREALKTTGKIFKPRFRWSYRTINRFKAFAQRASRRLGEIVAIRVKPLFSSFDGWRKKIALKEFLKLPNFGLKFPSFNMKRFKKPLMVFFAFFDRNRSRLLKFIASKLTFKKINIPFKFPAFAGKIKKKFLFWGEVINETYNSVIDYIEQRIAEVGKLAEKIAFPWKKRVKKGAEIGKNIVLSVTKNIEESAIALFLPIINFAKKRGTKLNFGFHFRKERFKKAVRKVLSVLRFVRGTLFLFLLSARNFVLRFIRLLLARARDLYRILKTFLRFLRAATIIFFYLLRLLLAYARVLFRYGLMRVRTIVQDLLDLS